MQYSLEMPHLDFEVLSPAYPESKGVLPYIPLFSPRFYYITKQKQFNIICGHHRIAHELVNDPTKGYGIFIENMLDAAG